MKYKYFLRGFGVGVLFATLILMLAIAISENIPKKSEKSDNKVNEVINSEGNIKKEESLSEKHEMTKDEAGKQETAKDETTQDTTSETTPEKTTSEETTPEETTSKEETTPKETTESDMVTFTLQRGMTSGEVALLLEENGVVDNAHNFNEYMQQNGYSSRLRIGVYTIKKGSTYEEVAMIIVPQ